MEFNRKALTELVEKDLRDFCEKVQVSRTQAYGYIAGEGDLGLPGIPTFIRIMETFGLPPGHFFINESESNSV